MADSAIACLYFGFSNTRVAASYLGAVTCPQSFISFNVGLFYFWLCWVFVAVRRLFFGCEHRLLSCGVLGLLLLQSTGSRAHGPR